jgi:PAS domain S-box-containing protein
MADGIQVLYIDDEPGLIEIGKIFLENTGEFSVDTALSASVALDILNKKKYDAIVSDFQMPKMDGIELLKKVRSFDKNIPFILFTGRGREEVVIDAINNGADFYIQKGGEPIAQFAELAHKIRQSVLMRRTQVTIAEQEQRYHDLQNANDLIQSVAPDGHFLFVNQKWLDTLGYKEEELANLTIFDVIHEESIKHCMETFQQVISGENVGIIDATFRTRDGVKVYVEGMANCKLIDGLCQYTRGIFKNITDRKKAELELVQKNEDLNAAYEELTATEEELRHNFDLLSQKEQALRESEEKYRLLTEVTDDVIYMIDVQGTITHISPQIARYGYKLEEVISHNFAEFIAETDVPNVVADFKAVIKTRTQMVTTIRIRDKAGNLHWMEDNGAPVYDSSGSIIAISGILRDISGRRKAEEALTESEEMFRSIFEHSPYPIAINSLPDNKFIEVNKSFLDISEYTEAEIIGKDPIAMGFLPLTDALKLISHRVITGKIENVPLVVTAKGGKRVHVLFSSMPITINNKPAIVTVTAEVTKLKRVEEDLLKKNEELNAAYEEIMATDEELRANYDEHRKKEEAIRASEEQFRVLVELSLDGIIITDFLGKLLFANRAAGLIVDAPDYEAMIGNKNVLDFVAPESKVDVLRDLGKVALGIDSYLVNYKLISQTKREVWIECIGKKISFRNSSAMLVSMRDVTERKLAEERVRESENKFSTLFKNSPVSLTLVSATDGTIIDVNDAFLRSTGYSRHEVVGSMAVALGIFADKSEYKRFSTVLRNQRTVHGMEMKCRIKNGEIRTCRFSSGIIMMDNKPHILSTVDDITEQKATELALQALVRSMVGTTGLDSLKKITENVSSWLGADCVMVGEIQPDRESVKVLSMLLDGKEVHDFSYTLKGTPCENVADKGFCLYPDNAIALFPESKDLVELKIRGYIGTPLRNSGGQVIGILCALSRVPLTSTPTIQEIMDIIAVKAAAEIERIQTEFALFESEEKYRTLFDSAGDVIFIHDMNGRILAFNTLACEKLGYTRPELMSMMVGEVDSQENALHAPARIARLKEQVHISFETVHRRKDGQLIPIEVSAKLITWEGQPAVMSICHDITERKRADEALHLASKKLNLLSSITRHDIKNQLLTLDGFATLLHKKIPDPSFEHYFSRINRASNQITNMIQFTKEYEKIGLNAPTWQDIRILVEKAGRDNTLGQITLKNDLPANMEVYADPLIAKVFFNLIDNSVRHGGKITTIRFSLEERDGERIVVCEDDGDGVAPEEKERIFDLGFGKNTGFGLAISREILDITGITIKETGEPGKGARFEIAVPKNQFRFALTKPISLS